LLGFIRQAGAKAKSIATDEVLDVSPNCSNTFVGRSISGNFERIN
jgi:hypothetical protein